MKRKYLIPQILLIIFSQLSVLICKAQDFGFSQFYNTPTLVNPALIAEDDQNTRFNFSYRLQSLETDDNNNTALLGLHYPTFFSKDGQRRGVLGLTFYYDNLVNFLESSGGLFTFAYGIKKPWGIINLGLQAGINQRRINNEGFTTDSQYTDEFGFNPDSDTQEAFGNQAIAFPTFSSGIYLRSNPESHKRFYYFGLALNNWNEPDIAFIGNVSNNLPRNFHMMGAWEAWRGVRLSIIPNFQWVNRLNENNLTLGSWLHYHVGLGPEKDLSDVLKLGAWYHSNQIFTLGMGLDRKKYAITASYDLPLGQNQLAFPFRSTVEINVKFKITRTPKNKRKEPGPIDMIADTVVYTDTIRVIEKNTFKELGQDSIHSKTDVLTEIPIDEVDFSQKEYEIDTFFVEAILEFPDLLINVSDGDNFLSDALKNDLNNIIKILYLNPKIGVEMISQGDPQNPSWEAERQEKLEVLKNYFKRYNIREIRINYSLINEEERIEKGLIIDKNQILIRSKENSQLP